MVFDSLINDAVVCKQSCVGGNLVREERLSKTRTEPWELPPITGTLSDPDPQRQPSVLFLLEMMLSSYGDFL